MRGGGRGGVGKLSTLMAFEKLRGIHLEDEGGQGA